MIIVTALCLAQSAYDVVATQRWNAYIAAVEQRLAASTGLVAWESIMGSVDERDSREWRLMIWTWTMPSLSIVLSRDGRVASMILNPADASGWQPFDPSRSKSLPIVRGVAYGDALRGHTLD